MGRKSHNLRRNIEVWWYGVSGPSANYQEQMTVDVTADWRTLAEVNRLCFIRTAVTNVLIIIIIFIVIINIWRGEEEC